MVVRRGDFTKDSADEVAKLIIDADPDEECTVIWAGAPPCQNFSVKDTRLRRGSSSSRPLT